MKRLDKTYVDYTGRSMSIRGIFNTAVRIRQRRPLAVLELL